MHWPKSHGFLFQIYTGTGGNRTVQEHSPNSMSVYSKIIMYISIAYASTDRFVHMGCLGNKALLAALFGAQRMPEAATSLTRFFNKIKSLHYANIHPTTSSLSCTAHTKRVSSLWFLYDKAGQAITSP